MQYYSNSPSTSKVPFTLVQGPADFFCKRLDSHYCRLGRLSASEVTVQLCPRGAKVLTNLCKLIGVAAFQ